MKTVGIGTAAAIGMFAFSVAALVAAPSPSKAADTVKCEAEVGGDHCCACGIGGGGHIFCTEIQENAHARCESGSYCEGLCEGDTIS